MNGKFTFFNPNVDKSWNEYLLNFYHEQGKTMHDDPMDIDPFLGGLVVSQDNSLLVHEMNTVDRDNNGDDMPFQEHSPNDYKMLVHNSLVCDTDRKNEEKLADINFQKDRKHNRINAPFGRLYKTFSGRAFGPLLSERHGDKNFNMSDETSKFNLQVQQDRVEEMDQNQMTEKDERDTEQIERLVISEIELMRRRLGCPLLNRSKDIKKTAKSLSNLYCIDNEPFEVKRPFQCLSYELHRRPGQSPKSYADMLSRHWFYSKTAKRLLSSLSITDVGVGVWASPESVIISVLTYAPPATFLLPEIGSA